MGRDPAALRRSGQQTARSLTNAQVKQFDRLVEDFERNVPSPHRTLRHSDNKAYWLQFKQRVRKKIKRSTRWGAKEWTKQRHLALARLDSSGRLEYVKKWNNGGGAEAEHPVGTRHKVMTRACNAKSNERRKQKPQNSPEEKKRDAERSRRGRARKKAAAEKAFDDDVQNNPGMHPDGLTTKDFPVIAANIWHSKKLNCFGGKTLHDIYGKGTEQPMYMTYIGFTEQKGAFLADITGSRFEEESYQCCRKRGKRLGTDNYILPRMVDASTGSIVTTDVIRRNSAVEVLFTPRRRKPGKEVEAELHKLGKQIVKPGHGATDLFRCFPFLLWLADGLYLNSDTHPKERRSNYESTVFLRTFVIKRIVYYPRGAARCAGRPAFAQLADKSWVRLVYGEADCNFQIDPKKPNSKPYAQFAIGDCKRRPSCGH